MYVGFGNGQDQKSKFGERFVEARLPQISMTASTVKLL
jgi:hypothetical protein